jgi:hypothetical protein
VFSRAVENVLFCLVALNFLTCDAIQKVHNQTRDTGVFSGGQDAGLPGQSFVEREWMFLMEECSVVVRSGRDEAFANHVAISRLRCLAERIVDKVRGAPL